MAKRDCTAAVAEANLFIDHYIAPHKLTPAQSTVWFVLWRWNFHGVVRLGQGRIARLANVNKSTVQRAIKKLIAVGLLKIKSKGKPGWVTVYTMVPPDSGVAVVA